MSAADKIKKTKLMILVKEINRSKEDIIKYLNSIGVDKVSINTSLEPDIVAKVNSYFRKDIEDQDKHLKKVVDFAQKNRIEIYEADEKIKQQETERQRLEEEARLRKVIVEENRRKEEERKKQELQAYLERERVKKENEEKRAKEKAELEKILDEKKKKKEEAKKKEEEKKKEEARKKEEILNALKAKEVKAKEKAKEAEKKTAAKKTEEKPAEPAKKAVISPKEEVKKAEVKPKITEPAVAKKSEAEKIAGKKPHFAKRTDEKPQYAKRTDERPQYAKKTDERPSKPGFKKDIHRERKDDRRPPKSKFEKVTIKDIKKAKKKPESKIKTTGEEKPPEQVGRPETASLKEQKWLAEKKEKERKLKLEQDYEKRKKVKLVKGHREKSISQQEIDDAIRETFAKIGDEGGTSARSQLRKKKKKERLEREEKIQALEQAQSNIIKVTEFISASELANLMNIDSTTLIQKCFGLGMMVTINQRLEKDLIILLGAEFGYQIEFQTEYEEDSLKDDSDPPETLVERPPVVTVMGHVDHGKTSLLDYIRKANVVAGEAGGITQHIGAYQVVLENKKAITFLDTPGHEAFTAMRARGGQAADLVVLVVAADDSVMPQTVEAIHHALAANVPIVIAINKIDKPNANIDRIKQQLSEKNILVEEWGGKYQSVEISAKFGKNIEGLLEKILLEAEMLEIKSNPNRNARGVVLEAQLDKGKGIIVTILIQKGTLKIGDNFVAGMCSGRVKAMFDERGHRIIEAKPSTPVQLLGMDAMPQAGDTFIVLDSEREVKEIALKRQQLKREQDYRQIKFITLDDISKQIKEGKQVELNLIIKGDTDGSVEALSDSLLKLETNEVKVRVVYKGLGQISESDVLLAEASNAIIIGFNVRPNLNARKLAEKNSIDIRLHNIIYNVIDEVKLALEGLLEPEITEEITATVEVRDIFKVPKVGNVAGCYVQDGKITRNNKIRLVRDGFVIFTGNIASLKRIKDDVREVESGYECGIGLENFNDFKIKDIIEGFKIIETKRKLTI
jgi:translation initiation factor IF-2